VSREVGEPLRQYIAKRAGYRCEYCLLHEEAAGFPHQVDHVISRKHGGSSDERNLAYCCVACNRYKGADVAAIDPVSGRLVRLFNPRIEIWADHFSLVGPVIEPLTEVGTATTRILRINAAERVIERQQLQRVGLYPLRWPGLLKG
jgi:hypothetical protein